MKTLLAVVLVCLAWCGCNSSPTPSARIEITTTIGRKEVATRRYTIEQIESGSAAVEARAQNPFGIQHPVYPSKEQLASLRQHLKHGGDVWYFQGFDSGWAVIKNREVLWVVVTTHEY
ncbi:MAG TPA: hypothetical protein VIM71_00045 [Lacunisphaera sp.]